jgi:putative transcriptional regulator
MQNIEKGKLLIAEPSLLEDDFFKSVILLTHHNYEESIGLVLNKPSKISLFEIINDIPESDFPVYIGGPVAKKSIHFIHNIGSTIIGAKEVMKGLFFGGDFDIVKDLIKNRQITKDDIRFFAGYSGWEDDQLKNELKDQSWIIKEGSCNICMQYSDMNLWSKIIKSLDEKYAIWSNMPANPNLN